jgi:hypothetical protein
MMDNAFLATVIDLWSRQRSKTVAVFSRHSVIADILDELVCSGGPTNGGYEFTAFVESQANRPVVAGARIDDLARARSSRDGFAATRKILAEYRLKLFAMLYGG